MAPLTLTFRARVEAWPGSVWQSWFYAHAPAYRAWYLSGGHSARPSLQSCMTMLATHMPELVPVHQRLVELAGGSELDSRMLSLYSGPPFVTGCSQVAWTRGSPVLIRNYDYPVTRLEGLLLLTSWGRRRVIGMSDCLWGLLDGMNDSGLAVSLTFGGRAVSGDGFAIPLVVRHLLEVCDSVDEACNVLARVPVHASQNLTLVDVSGNFTTAYLGPDRPAHFARTPVSTNHQGSVEWPEYERAVRSLERERWLLRLVGAHDTTLDRLQKAFLEPPVYSESYLAGAGTLYNASYHLAEGRVELRWPHERWSQSFGAFDELDHTQHYAGGARPPEWRAF